MFSKFRYFPRSFQHISTVLTPFTQDVWMFVATKLLALALISCVSMTDAWKWPIAFSVAMAVIVGVCQPYMWPQAGPTEIGENPLNSELDKVAVNFKRIRRGT